MQSDFEDLASRWWDGVGRGYVRSEFASQLKKNKFRRGLATGFEATPDLKSGIAQGSEWSMLTKAERWRVMEVYATQVYQNRGELTPEMQAMSAKGHDMGQAKPSKIIKTVKEDV